MADANEVKKAIQDTITALMSRVLDNVLRRDPFVPEEHHAKKPLYAALVPDEIFRGSHFERRFVTSFGGAWEQLAVSAARQGLGLGALQRTVVGTVAEDRLRRITEILNKLEHPSAPESPRLRPNWTEELAYVRQAGGEPIPCTVVCDLYAENTTTGERLAFELKAPLPNSDQTRVSKEKLLKLYSMEPCPIDMAYFALPYNPYGSRVNYAWSFPARWFDMHADPVVLIGDEFWERVGGGGTYAAFLEAVREIAPRYREIIYRDYLKMTPPPESLDVDI